jgi:hypothetical protein
LGHNYLNFRNYHRLSYRMTHFVISMYNFIDACFFIDIFLTFFTSYTDLSKKEIINLKKIARNYVRGWFFIDIFSIFPFELILELPNFNGLLRISRIWRIIRLIRMIRLFRIYKYIKSKHGEGHSIFENLSISSGS